MTRIFVSNLPYGVTERELVHLFSTWRCVGDGSNLSATLLGSGRVEPGYACACQDMPTLSSLQQFAKQCQRGAR